MQPREEGFEESDDDNIMTSKLKDHLNQQPTLNSYYIVPDAKPLLSKNTIDIDKPKVLIKQIQFTKEPEELLHASISKDVFSADKNHNARQIPNMRKVESTSIWNKYIVSQGYRILYLKYYREDIGELQNRGFKKFKLELQKLCRHQQNLFSTYIIDLSFLNEAGSYLLRNLKPATLPEIKARPYPETQRIKFDSRFECGNLFSVFEKKNPIKPEALQYDLVLQSDVNTKGYSNWFYFSFHLRKKGTVKFNIVNMQKIHSLFTKGMKAAFYSHGRQAKEGLGWHRDGYNYAYYRNQLLKNSETNVTYNTLSFEYDVKYDDDLVYVAANMPYSYSKLLEYLDSVQKIAKLNSSIYLKKDIIANSISSNQCPVLTLTWKRDKKKDNIRKKKKVIGVIARQHPSQTVSSYVMEGFINSLVQLSDESSVALLQNYIFKIIPMVNIDGVIYGNSRCDITGSDINRKWTRSPNKFMYPVVAAIRSLFVRMNMEEYEIDYFIDLHGHSRSMGAFIYGCKTFDDIETRQTAWIMSRLNSKFLFQECSFGLSPFKRETARGIMSDLVTRKKSMTLETSFYGYRTVTNRHFDIKDLHRIGSTITQALYAQYSRDPKILNWQSIRTDIADAIIANRQKNADKNDHQSEDSSFGSDSDPEEDEMTNKEKAELFLDPATAAKIGLNDVKIIEKSKRQKKRKEEIEEEEKEKYEMIVDGFNSKIDFTPQQSSILEPYRSSEGLKQKQKKFVIRETKSVTKILPFRLSQRPEKGNSQQKNFRSRQSVDTFLNRPQKLSIPDLPKVQKKSNFWSSLKKEYQCLLSQKKTGLLKLS